MVDGGPDVHVGEIFQLISILRATLCMVAFFIVFFVCVFF